MDESSSAANTGLDESSTRHAAIIVTTHHGQMWTGRRNGITMGITYFTASSSARPPVGTLNLLPAETTYHLQYYRRSLRMLHQILPLRDALLARIVHHNRWQQLVCIRVIIIIVDIVGVRALSCWLQASVRTASVRPTPQLDDQHLARPRPHGSDAVVFVRHEADGVTLFEGRRRDRAVCLERAKGAARKGRRRAEHEIQRDERASIVVLWSRGSRRDRASDGIITFIAHVLVILNASHSEATIEQLPSSSSICGLHDANQLLHNLFYARREGSRLQPCRPILAVVLHASKGRMALVANCSCSACERVDLGERKRASLAVDSCALRRSAVREAVCAVGGHTR